METFRRDFGLLTECRILICVSLDGEYAPCSCKALSIGRIQADRGTNPWVMG